MTNQVKKVPELRFPEFDGEWEEKKLGDIAHITMGQSPKSSNYTNNDQDMVLVQGNADMKKGQIYPRIYTIEITKLAEIDDILLSVRAPVGELAIAQIRACIGRGVCAINANKFVYYNLELFKVRNTWKLFSQGSTFESISGNEIKKINFQIPISKSEQQKIGGFFSKLDRQIELEEQKLEKLEEQKKGYMQKIFSQELRFKDDNGNEYPEWQFKNLGELGDTFTGLSGKTKDDFGYGDGLFITYMNVFKNTIAKSNMVERVKIGSNENQNRVQYGDILFTTSSEVPNEVGMSSIWLFNQDNIYLNSFCFGFRVVVNYIKPVYLARYLRSEEMRKTITILAQGSTRFNISKKEMMKLNIKVPYIEEQIKIDNFFNKIDILILKQGKKIEILKHRKKGLLQKMFV